MLHSHDSNMSQFSKVTAFQERLDSSPIADSQPS